MESKLLEFIQNNHGLIKTNSMEGYDFLESDESCIVVENPNNSQDLLIHITPRSYTLGFDEWKQAYSHDEEGLDSLLEEAKNILNQVSYVWKAKIDGQTFVSLIRDENGVFYSQYKDGFELEVNGKPFSFSTSFQDESFCFWDPAMMHPDAFGVLM